MRGGQVLRARSANRMVCSNCNKREASHTVCGEDGTELHLCDGCYERLGGAASYLGEDAGFLADFLSTGQDEDVRCPVCGTTVADYRRTGLVGCASCYTAFREEIMPFVRRMHGKTRHVCKHPLGNGRLYELMDTLKSLRTELERALLEKRTEDTKRINRDIRDVQRMINEEGRHE